MYLRSVCAKALTAAICENTQEAQALFTASIQPFLKTYLGNRSMSELSVYLRLDHSLWNGVHGIIEPTFQAFGKVANGLSQGT